MCASDTLWARLRSRGRSPPNGLESPGPALTFALNFATPFQTDCTSSDALPKWVANTQATVMKAIFRNSLLVVFGMSGAFLPSSSPAQTGGNDVYQAIIKREFGTASNEMAAIEQQIQEAKPEQRSQIEGRLIAVLESPEATKPGKQFACQMLRIVGS